MRKYKGALLNAQGFIIYEFTTAYMNSYAEACSQARKVHRAWCRESNLDVDSEQCFWYLEEEGIEQ